MPYEDVSMYLNELIPISGWGHWSKVLESRKAFMMKHIKFLGQKKLADVSIWEPSADKKFKICDELSRTVVISTSKEKKFDDDTRGVFIYCPETYRNAATYDDPPKIRANQFEMEVVGFARTGDWLLSKVEIEYDHLGGICDKRLIIYNSPPEDWGRAHSIDLARVVSEFTRVMKKYAENRAELARVAQEMYLQARTEDRALGLRQ